MVDNDDDFKRTSPLSISELTGTADFDENVSFFWERW